MTYPLTITLDEAAARFPTLAQVAPHESRSEKRYRMVSTMDLLTALNREGFEIRHIATARTRDESKRGFEKHLIRLRRTGADLSGEYVPEIAFLNSHDGSTGAKLFYGVLRMACLNGCIFGEAWGAVSVYHRGPIDLSQRVVEAAYQILTQGDRAHDRIAQMRAIALTPQHELEFAERAHALRFPRAAESEELTTPFSPDRLLTVRRAADTGNDLWTVYSRVQENLIRGGFRARVVGNNGRPRRQTMREINGVTQNLTLNQGVWQIAEDFADRLAA
jgi:hypothetical protein